VTHAPRPPLDTPYVAPRDALEERVARRVGGGPAPRAARHRDDFFDLGGESLQAFALIARVTTRSACR
jgi:hypothetical protein